MDQRTAELLQRLVRHNARSLLQYVADAYPWAAADDGATMPKLQQLVEEDREAAAGLVRFLRKQRVVLPYLGAYPEHFTALNFLSLDRLLSLLVEHQRRTVAELESDLARIQEPEARHQVEQLLETKRRHLAALSELQTSPHPSTRV